KEDRTDDRDVFAFASRLREPLVDRRHEDVVDVLRRVERVDEDAVRVETDRFGVVLVDRGDEDLGGRVGDRSGREERVVDRRVVELAAMLCGTTLLPR